MHTGRTSNLGTESIENSAHILCPGSSTHPASPWPRQPTLTSTRTALDRPRANVPAPAGRGHLATIGQLHSSLTQPRAIDIVTVINSHRPSLDSPEDLTGPYGVQGMAV